MKKTEPKVILITGASSGMGKVTALHLCKQGHIVYGAARRVEQMQDIEDVGGHAVGMDITDEAQIEQAVNRVIQEQGRIDVLWNNAGYGLYGSVEDVGIDEAHRQFEVNLFGLARMTQLVLPHMRSQKSGLIINTTSVGGKINTPLGAWYHATKYALEGWSDCLRLETKSFGIDVVVLEPGMIKTEFGNVMSKHIGARMEKGTAYTELSNAIIEVTESMEQKDLGSDPMVIAHAIEKMINAKQPKTRYAVGQYAALFLTARRWLSDRNFDKFIMSQVNKIIKKNKA